MGILANVKRFFGIKEEPAGIKTQQSKEAFFLDSDAAQTLGDIDYMRQPKAVERTFPKVDGMNVGGLRTIKQFTSMEESTVYDGDGKPSSSAIAAASAAASTSTPAPAAVAAAPTAPAAPVAETTTEAPETTSTPEPEPQKTIASAPTDTLDFRSMARDIKR